VLKIKHFVKKQEFCQQKLKVMLEFLQLSNFENLKVIVEFLQLSNFENLKVIVEFLQFSNLEIIFLVYFV